MIRQSEFKRKYDPELGKYTKQHIYGEGIMDTVKSFFKPTPKTSKPKAPPKPPKKVTFADKKVGDKIVELLSRENPPPTAKPTCKKTHHQMTEKEYNQYLGNLKLYNY